MANGISGSGWIAGFERQLQRRKHVLLYGNVHDYMLWRDTYQTLPEFLRTFFLDSGFGIIAQYDPIDGLVFADESEEGASGRMREAYQKIRREAMVRRVPELNQEPTADTVRPPQPVAASSLPIAPPARGMPGAPVNGSPPQARITPVDAFAELRLALRQSSTSVAAIVSLGDMLTAEAGRYIADERGAVSTLKKCTLEASIIPSGKAAGYRNSVVVVAGDLKRVPEWFYMDNPFVGVVRVQEPTRDERRAFAIKFAGLPTTDGFYSGSPDGAAPSPAIAAIAEEFADLTQGMQTTDLEALRLTSHTARMPVREKQVKRLVDYYKFGIQEDPWVKLDANRIREAHDFLSRRVIGQEKAVFAVEDMLISSKVGVAMAPQGSIDRPKGVFFFVGPTGVGKTELAKAVTELVFHDPKSFVRFDMSEYTEEHAAEKLAGAPPGFVGYEEGGQLTNRVIQKPHSILLFDEIEKAHPKVLDKFLQILEDGRLTDGRGQTAYFNQSAIIFTSNIGASELMARVGELAASKLTYDSIVEHFERAVRGYFSSRMEILNRLGDSIVVFDILRPEHMPAITRKFLSLLSQSASDSLGAKLAFRDDTVDFISDLMQQADNVLFGGRRIKTLLGTYVERPFNRWVFENAKVEELAGRSLELGLSGKLELEVRYV